jgi:hypothetical protein
MSPLTKWISSALAMAGVASLIACMKAGDGVGADMAGKMCTSASTDEACIAYLDPCKANPAAAGCAVDCAKNPAAAGCPVDPCIANPALSGCKAECATTPTAKICVDSCKANPAQSWCAVTVDCAATPAAQVCVDSCAAHPELAFCGPPKTKFSEVYAVLTGSTCLQCHVPGGPGVMQGKLNMATADSAYANLVGVLATDQALAKDWLRVKAKSPDSSVLVLKVEAGLKGTKAKLADGTVYYDGMPLTGAPLTRAKIDLIRKWIQDGAVK